MGERRSELLWTWGPADEVMGEKAMAVNRDDEAASIGMPDVTENAAISGSAVSPEEPHGATPVVMLAAGNADASAQEGIRNGMQAARPATHDPIVASSRQGRMQHILARRAARSAAGDCGRRRGAIAGGADSDRRMRRRLSRVTRAIISALAGFGASIMRSVGALPDAVDAPAVSPRNAAFPL